MGSVMSKYIKYVERVVRERVVDTDAIAEDIKEYLSNSTISGETYSLKEVDLSFDDAILVRLLDSTGSEPDEDFESDDSWEEFLWYIKNSLGAEYVDVPFYYHAK